MRQKILLLAAVGFGLLATYLTYEQLQLEKNKLRSRTKVVKLIQLKNSLVKGEVIKDDDLVMKETEQFSSHRGDEIAWKNKDKDAIKIKVNRSMKAGEILEYTDLFSVRSSREGMAGIIKLGYRAISISVDATSSVTSLVKPDDCVDIVGTFRFPEMKGDNSLDVITMTILQCVRILATGKEMGRKRSRDNTSKSRGYNTVTLELSPKEVEMIIFAAQKGQLVLSLRSSQETGFTDDLQSVNFRYLEENIDKYNKAREKHTFR